MGGELDLTSDFKQESLKAAPPPLIVVEDENSSKNKKKNAQEQNKDDRNVLTNEEVVLKMPEFFEKIEVVKKEIEIIKKLEKDIEKTHKASLKATTIDESIKCSKEIETFMTVINQSGNRAKRLLDEIEKENKDLTALASTGSSSLRIRIYQHSHLFEKYIKAMKSFQKMQLESSERYKEQIKRQYLIVKPKATHKELKAIVEDPQVQQQIFASAIRSDTKQELKLMENRCQAMKDLEKSIIDLAQTFNDLKEMTFSQREMLRNVALNVQQSEGYSERAKEDTKKGVEELIKYRKRKIIIISVLAFVAFVIVMLIILKVISILRIPRSPFY